MKEQYMTDNNNLSKNINLIETVSVRPD